MLSHSLDTLQHSLSFLPFMPKLSYTFSPPTVSSVIMLILKMKIFSNKIGILRDNLNKCKLCVYLYIWNLVQEKHWVNAENFTRLNLATEQSTTHTDALTSKHLQVPPSTICVMSTPNLTYCYNFVSSCR